MLKVKSIETIHADLTPGKTILTKDKIYEVIYETRTIYRIRDDTGCFNS